MLKEEKAMSETLKGKNLILIVIVGILFTSLSSMPLVNAQPDYDEEETKLLELLHWLWFVVPLLIGFFVGILINGRKLKGLLAGAIGAVIFCYITVQIIYIMGYVLVVSDLSTGTRTEYTVFQAFVYAIFSKWGIIFGAIAGIAGSWLGKRARGKPVTRIPPQLVRGKLIEPRACPSCGNVNRLGDKFCRRCGTPLLTIPMEEKAYCTRCGTELKKGVKFCHSCGQAVTRITPPGEEIPAVEKVLGGIEVVKDYRYGLYFTPNRAIVAKTGGVRWYWLLLVIILGGIILGLILALIIAAIIGRRSKKKFKELSELSSESILTADKKNFGILYPDITRVEMKKRTFLRSKIEIILTSGEKHEFYILKKKEFEDYVNLIRSVLPNKTYVS